MTPTVPRVVSLRAAPFEQHMDAPYYPLYAGEKLWTILPAAYILMPHLETFNALPPRCAPAYFNPEAAQGKVFKAAPARIGG